MLTAAGQAAIAEVASIVSQAYTLASFEVEAQPCAAL